MEDIQVEESTARAFESPYFQWERVRSPDRWTFWKSAFNEIAGMEVAEDVQSAAVRAATAMWEAETEHWQQLRHLSQMATSGAVTE